jgi:hypothetical protein
VWPHYASRLSLELWTNDQINPQDSNTFYLRLVYNGDDVTSLIPSCSGKIIKEETQHTAAAAPTVATFCPLENVLEQFDQILAPYRNRKRACLAKKPS